MRENGRICNVLNDLTVEEFLETYKTECPSWDIMYKTVLFALTRRTYETRRNLLY